ncbi:hypothetical protein MRX96_042904 [Rhipicephalus microplus]
MLTFSTCSKRDIDTFLSTKNSSCLFSRRCPSAPISNHEQQKRRDNQCLSHKNQTEVFLNATVVPKVANVTLIDVGPDFVTVSWTKPAVSFDYYLVEVLYNSNESDMLTPHRVGSCANGTAVHHSQTQITCDKFKACANVTFTVHAHVETASQLTFSGTTLRALVDFDLYLEKVTTTTADIIIDPHLPRSCPPRYCRALICRFYKSGAIVRTCWGVECEARVSYSSEMVVKLKHLTPGGFHTCRVTLRYNDKVAKQIGFNAVQSVRIPP